MWQGERTSAADDEETLSVDSRRLEVSCHSYGNTLIHNGKEVTDVMLIENIIFITGLRCCTA